MPAVEVKILMSAALAAYLASAAVALSAPRAGGRGALAPLLALAALGLGANVAVLAIRAARGRFPVTSGFDTFATLALAAALMGICLKTLRVFRSPELVLLPLAAVCGVLALLLSGAAYRDFAADVWNAAHIAMAVIGTACMAAAGGAGVYYLRSYGRLRRKDPGALAPDGPSLERLERFIRHALVVGFALLSAAILLGLCEVFRPHRARWFRTWWTHPKMTFACVSWLVYATALHAAFRRRFRGRWTAVLSIVGLVLLTVVLLVSIFMPGV